MQNQTKKVLILIVVLVAIAAINLPRCFPGSNPPLQFTEAQLLDSLNDRLPFRMTAVSGTQVELDHPHPNLVDGSDRASLEFQVKLNMARQNAKQPLSGTMKVSAGVAFAIMRGDLYFADPMIEKLDVQGMPDGQSEHVEEAISEALTVYFADRPIYNVTRSDVPRLSAGTGVQEVKVKNRALAINLGD